MSLRSKSLELGDELKSCFAPDAGGLARKPASPRCFYRWKKGRAVVTTAALLKSFCELGNVM
jgi:hypothetical protein